MGGLGGAMGGLGGRAIICGCCGTTITGWRVGAAATAGRAGCCGAGAAEDAGCGGTGTPTIVGIGGLATVTGGLLIGIGGNGGADLGIAGPIFSFSSSCLQNINVHGFIYTKGQRQRCDNSTTMTLVILFSLKTIELIQN